MCRPFFSFGLLRLHRLGFCQPYRAGGLDVSLSFSRLSWSYGPSKSPPYPPQLYLVWFQGPWSFHPGRQPWVWFFLIASCHALIFGVRVVCPILCHPLRRNFRLASRLDPVVRCISSLRHSLFPSFCCSSPMPSSGASNGSFTFARQHEDLQRRTLEAGRQLEGTLLVIPLTLI